MAGAKHIANELKEAGAWVEVYNLGPSNDPVTGTNKDDGNMYMLQPDWSLMASDAAQRAAQRGPDVQRTYAALTTLRNYQNHYPTADGRFHTDSFTPSRGLTRDQYGRGPFYLNLKSEHKRTNNVGAALTAARTSLMPWDPHPTVGGTNPRDDSNFYQAAVAYAALGVESVLDGHLRKHFGLPGDQRQGSEGFRVQVVWL